VDKYKQSLYFPKEMLDEINREAVRLDRSLSWIVQRAWKVAKRQVQQMPSDPSLECEADVDKGDLDGP